MTVPAIVVGVARGPPPGLPAPAHDRSDRVRAGTRHGGPRRRPAPPLPGEIVRQERKAEPGTPAQP